MSPCFDIHATRRRMEQIDNIFLHGGFEGGHLGSFQNECHVNIPHLVPVILHDLVGVFHKFATITTLPSRIGILKDLSNIRQGESSKNCIDNGMVNDIAIGMGHDPQFCFVNFPLFHVFPFGVGPFLGFVVNHHTPNHDGLSGVLQGSHAMNIKTMSNAQGDLFNFVRWFQEIVSGGFRRLFLGGKQGMLWSCLCSSMNGKGRRLFETSGKENGEKELHFWVRNYEA
mmetsp:Transcript_32572/g.67935  ORF Transcript_32572/g.67935 Transcript_32572/m.67935 type:complete len:227 (+) Transcript_32572:1529-2209(+)